MPYTPTNWVAGTTPALNETNLDKLTNELESQASEVGVSHSLPDWIQGASQTTPTNAGDPRVNDESIWIEHDRVLQLVTQALGASYTTQVWPPGALPTETKLDAIETRLQDNRVILDGQSQRRAQITWAELEVPGIDTRRSGVVTWAEFEVPGAGVPLQSWYRGSALGGGRGQAVAVSPFDSNIIIHNGDLGGSAICEDPTGLHPWTQTTDAITDVNSQRPGDSVAWHPTIAGRCYKLTHGGLWRSSDYGRVGSWVRDTLTGNPTHQDGQPTSTTARQDGPMPRLVGKLVVVDPQSGIEVVGSDAGIKRYRPTPNSWDGANFPGSTDFIACVFNNPSNPSEVWVCSVKWVASGYYARLYRTTNITAATPTWTGPFTNSNAAGWFPQEGRHTGSSVIIISVNPHAANTSHGVYRLNNPTTATANAAWTKLDTVTTNPATYTGSGNRLCSLDVKTIGTQTMCVATWGMGISTGETIAVRGISNDKFVADLGDWVSITADHPNLINGQAGQPWNYLNSGTVVMSPTRGFVAVDIDPQDFDNVYFGGYQGFYRSTNFLTGTPVRIRPIPYGAGGPVDPSCCFDPNDSRKLYFGFSDEGFSASYDKGRDPGKCMTTSLPTGVADQHFAIRIDVASTDGEVYMASYNNADVADGGIYRHPTIDPSSPSWANGDWTKMTGFPNGSGATSRPFGLKVWNNASNTRILIASYGTAGWFRSTNNGAGSAVGTPPANPTRKVEIDAVEGTNNAICYVVGAGSGNGVYRSSDSGSTWTQILSGTIGNLVGGDINFAGWVRFKPEDINTAFVASDTKIWQIDDVFGTPVVDEIHSGGVNRPGPMAVHDTGIIVVNRNTGTQPAVVYRADFPSGTPLATEWVADPDPTGLLAGWLPYSRYISSYRDGSVAIASMFAGTLVYG